MIETEDRFYITASGQKELYPSGYVIRERRRVTRKMEDMAERIEGIKMSMRRQTPANAEDAEDRGRGGPRSRWMPRFFVKLTPRELLYWGWGGGGTSRG